MSCFDDRKETVIKTCFIDGKTSGCPVFSFGKKTYRSQIASVMPGDQLFAGTIYDNISFFYNDSNRDQVCQAAAAASIHDEIMKIPMAYNTLVGYMASSLSGGKNNVSC